MSNINNNVLDVSIVTYRPEQNELRELVSTLASALSNLPNWVGPVSVRVTDNSCCIATTKEIEAEFRSVLPAFHSVHVQRADSNLGFGCAHNRNVGGSGSRFVLLLNQDITISPTSISELLKRASADENSVAGWEMRQIPYEHPKAYDPVSLETPWISGAACLLKREAFVAVGGFDEKIFMYGEDVDLSWRLRAAGWRLRYMPMCPIVHKTYSKPGQVKRLQVTGGCLTNLCLRARYGDWKDVSRGVLLLLAAAAGPQDFSGRRLALLGVLPRFAQMLPYFRRTAVKKGTNFEPHFASWNYELRRDGAFFEFPSPGDWQSAGEPLVTILIRTTGRHAWLRQALRSVANQTYSNLEVVLIEDGPATCQPLVDEYKDRLRINYLALGSRRGRSTAGNEAMRAANGEWFCFLDDDDVLFADHIEVCLWTCLKQRVVASYALAWETRTRVTDQDFARYEEVLHSVVYRQPFDRVTLWHHNFLPIQCVLFHRRLFDQNGGFDEALDQLEDWNLWTRYSLADDFHLIEKVTSKYRVPSDMDECRVRQNNLDQAYESVAKRQSQMRVTLTIPEVQRLIANHLVSRNFLTVEIPKPRFWNRSSLGFRLLRRASSLVPRLARRLMS